MKSLIVFIDYSKAFDVVFQWQLWEVRDRRQISKHLIEVMKNLYNSTVICVEKSEEINVGVRQGCSMSPILRNLYADSAIHEWK